MTPLRTPSLLPVCAGRSSLARAIVALTNSATNAAIRVVVLILLLPQGRASLGLVSRQQVTRMGAEQTRLLAAEAQARTAPATSAANWAASVDVVPTRTPWASRASFLPSAVPAVPEMIAPARPIVFPGGAEKPAM